MNYYTFKELSNISLETFHTDSYWRKGTICTEVLINALLVKFIWNFKDKGYWPLASNDKRLWFER
jgi:hypothetical protein